MDNSEFYNIYSESRSLFEIILCADHCNILSYADDGGAVSVLEDREDAGEASWTRNGVLPIRDDILVAFRDLLRVKRRYACENRIWERMAADHVASLAFRPWLPQMRWLLRAARHKENFGVFVTSRFVTSRYPVNLRERLKFVFDVVRDPRNFLARQHWPAGSIYAHLGRLPAMVYAVLRRRRR